MYEYRKIILLLYLLTTLL